jgi:type 1 glutamine amidotransferase
MMLRKRQPMKRLFSFVLLLTALSTFAAGADPAPKPAKAPAPENAKRAPDAKRILLITGQGYRKRKGRVPEETDPVLRDQLQKDTRLAVDLVNDLNILRSKEDLSKYAAVVMHFKNKEQYNPKVPGREGYDNLASFVEKGGGLVLVHFACGAFQEFKDDFVKIAGRVWNPKMRGHDRFGTFQVEVAKPDHPALAGLTSFETTDELYTCLDGDTPIDVLATAVSKVDGKTYPMVFVLEYGEGRVFHCPLGHNLAALTNEPAAELFRRGTAWAAGMEAVEKK